MYFAAPHFHQVQLVELEVHVRVPGRRKSAATEELTAQPGEVVKPIRRRIREVRARVVGDVQLDVACTGSFQVDGLRNRRGLPGARSNPGR
jgi:hypothetical protein